MKLNKTHPYINWIPGNGTITGNCEPKINVTIGDARTQTPLKKVTFHFEKKLQEWEVHENIFS